MEIPYESKELSELNELSAEIVESTEQVEPIEKPDVEVKSWECLGKSPSFKGTDMCGCACSVRMSCTVGV